MNSKKVALYATFCEKQYFLSIFDVNLLIFYLKAPEKLHSMQFLLRRVQLFKIRQVNIKIIYFIYKDTNKTRF